MAVLRNVKVLFSNVVAIDDFSQKYQIVVAMTEEQAADAEEAGLNVKTKEYDGRTQHQATFKTKFKPVIKGPDGQTDLDLGTSEIGRHSVVSVQYKFRDWTNMGKSGISQDLQMVQVKEMEASNASEFEDDSEFGEAKTDY